VAMLEEVTVCSPSYIAAFGRPERWDRLSGHRMVGFMSSARGQVLPLEFLVDGVAREVTLPSIMTVNAAQSYGEAGRHGLGLIQAPRYGLADFLARGELVEVLRETPPSPSPVSLLYPRSRQLSPRLRVFIDWAAGLFQGQTI
jgi:DNA-binding transcriptional LysR family regulator